MALVALIIAVSGKRVGIVPLRRSAFEIGNLLHDVSSGQSREARVFWSSRAGRAVAITAGPNIRGSARRDGIWSRRMILRMPIVAKEWIANLWDLVGDSTVGHLQCSTIIGCRFKIGRINWVGPSGRLICRSSTWKAKGRQSQNNG